MTEREYDFYCPTCDEVRNGFMEIEYHGENAICTKCKFIVQKFVPSKTPKSSSLDNNSVSI